MTTAHRPTWAPARGGEEQGGNRMFVPSLMRSSKDATAQTKLKMRQDGQGASGADFKEELLREERKAAAKKLGLEFEEERQRDIDLLNAGLGVGPSAGGGGGRKRPPAAMLPEAAAAARGGDDDDDDAAAAAAAAPRGRRLVPNPEDADDVDEDDDEKSGGKGSGSDGDGGDSDDDDDDSDSDEEEELRRELERIRRERAEEAERRAAEGAAREQAEKIEEVRGGNPLLDLEGGAGGGGGGVGGGGASSSSLVRRRWDDDVVFKNQARGEPKQQRRFINDTVRSDFHRRFMNRYIK